jgi:hypothetical protein
MANEIAEFERRRYVELLKQQAITGYSTEPAILLEIADLRQKYGPISTDGQTYGGNERRNGKNLQLDFELLMATVSSVVYRVNNVEQLAQETQQTIKEIRADMQRDITMKLRIAYIVGTVAVLALIGLMIEVAHSGLR